MLNKIVVILAILLPGGLLAMVAYQIYWQFIKNRRCVCRGRIVCNRHDGGVS